MITPRTIERDELAAALARRDPLRLVMAGSAWSFRAKHIPGSLHFDRPAQMLAALAKDEPVVVYCSNIDCHASLAAYQQLMDAGHTNVRHYRGGLLDWEAAGLPLEGEWAPAPAR